MFVDLDDRYSSEILEDGITPLNLLRASTVNLSFVRYVDTFNTREFDRRSSAPAGELVLFAEIFELLEYRSDDLIAIDEMWISEIQGEKVNSRDLNFTTFQIREPMSLDIYEKFNGLQQVELRAVIDEDKTVRRSIADRIPLYDFRVSAAQFEACYSAQVENVELRVELEEFLDRRGR